MFDCINCFLPTPILEHFTTNATIHAHHIRQRNIPTSLKHLVLYLKEQLLIKGQTFGEKYHTQSDYIKTRIPSLDYKKRLHHQKQLNVLLMTLNCWELSLFYRVSAACVGVLWRWRSCRLAGWVHAVGGCAWVRLLCSCLLPILMSCVRSCSGWVRPALSRWCSLVVLPAVCECAHGRWADPSRYLACLL